MASITEPEIRVHRLTNLPHAAWDTDFRHRSKFRKVSPKVDGPICRDKVRFVCISDTHNRHDRVKVPPGDVLLHAGDFSMKGRPSEVKKFNDFLGKLPHQHKFVIAGNHDSTFDACLPGLVSAAEEELEKYGVHHMKDLLTNCTYLEDQGTEVCGIKIYGSPWQPIFCGFGFNIKRGEAILEKWNMIPSDTEILMTHGPPLGYGDRCFNGIDGDRAGCVELLQTVLERVKPKYHVFGHIHEDYGVSTNDVTTFINAACCDANYRPVNPPIVFDLPIPNG